MRTEIRVILDASPVTELALENLGFTKHVCGYWCVPGELDKSLYRVELRPYVTQGDSVLNTKFCAFVLDEKSTRIMWLDNLRQLYHLHAAYHGKQLY